MSLEQIKSNEQTKIVHHTDTISTLAVRNRNYVNQITATLIQITNNYYSQFSIRNRKLTNKKDTILYTILREMPSQRPATKQHTT